MSSTIEVSPSCLPPKQLTEQEQRNAVVKEARRWVGTKYHHAADVFGAGVDCGMLLVRVFVDLGLVPRFDPRPYSHDWNMHRSEEKYTEIIESLSLRTLDSLDELQPGDIVTWRWGRTFSHGGIVTSWPRFVHAYATAQVVQEDDYRYMDKLHFLRGEPRPMKLYSLWGK